MKTPILKNSFLLLAIALLLTFSACNIIGSSDSDKFFKITIDGQIFEADDIVSIKVTNNYSNDIYLHDQGAWSLQQFVDNKWKTIYSPITDFGPPRFSSFIEAGEVKQLKFSALPDGALYESGHNDFRFTFGLFHEPDISSPLPVNQRVTPRFTILIE